MFDSTGNWPKWVEKAADWVNKNIVQPVKTTVNNAVDKVKATLSKIDFKTIADKAGQTAKAVYNSIEVSVGVGLGLLAEADVGDVVGLGLGIKYDLVEVSLNDGAVSANQSYFMGLSGSLAFVDVLQDAGESASRKLSFSSPVEEFVPDGYNTNWTIFSTSAYFFAGGSIYIGFDVISFLEEIDNIYFYN